MEVEDGSTAAGAAAVGLTGADGKTSALVLWGRNSVSVFTGASRCRVPPLQLLSLEHEAGAIVYLQRTSRVH